ncbi:lectin family integral membrane [Lecanosticta acicola]|uniref:Lectin family integral membrane n=1 Tax=Lecanosticta acicola TaxID=111012 RepID=A0AAI8YV48_9PEZI|nr:lectin family integral membrane [Lecanosticta acicola]
MSRLSQSFAWLLLASIGSASAYVDSLSFGHQGNISPDNRGISGWQASSVNHNIQILSDRVILTPPVPGNAKGALWSEATAPQAGWTAELDFRASGQEWGSGNINVWYTKDKDAVGTNSVYNADKFDGLVLVVDQYGGSGGKIRGFLNDGSQNFRSHTSLEALAFGHCDYSYRNLGRTSKLRIISNNNGLSVSIDDKSCFSTEKIALPAGYHFGITSSTGENPDSFELTRFTVETGGESDTQTQQQQNAQNQQNVQTQQSVQNQQPLQKLDNFPDSPEILDDRNADEFKSQAEQFADLHNRLQNLQHLMITTFTRVRMIRDKIDSQHSDMVQNVQNIGGSKETGLPPEVVGKISNMERKIENMEKILEIVKRDVEGKDYRQHLNEINMAMDRLHTGLTADLPDRILGIISRHKPSFGLFVFIVVGVQILLAGGYVAYKRRRYNSPKKFL